MGNMSLSRRDAQFQQLGLSKNFNPSVFAHQEEYFDVLKKVQEDVVYHRVKHEDKEWELETLR